MNRFFISLVALFALVGMGVIGCSSADTQALLGPDAKASKAVMGDLSQEEVETLIASDPTGKWWIEYNYVLRAYGDPIPGLEVTFEPVEESMDVRVLTEASNGRGEIKVLIIANPSNPSFMDTDVSGPYIYTLSDSTGRVLARSSETTAKRFPIISGERRVFPFSLDEYYPEGMPQAGARPPTLRETVLYGDDGSFVGIKISWPKATGQIRVVTGSSGLKNDWLGMNSVVLNMEDGEWTDPDATRPGYYAYQTQSDSDEITQLVVIATEQAEQLAGSEQFSKEFQYILARELVNLYGEVDFRKVAGITSLEIKSTTVGDISQDLELMTNLEEMKLVYTRGIKQFSFLSSLTRLEVLEIRGVETPAELPLGAEHRRMKVLRLLGTGITTVPDFVARLPSLERFEVRTTQWDRGSVTYLTNASGKEVEVVNLFNW